MSSLQKAHGLIKHHLCRQDLERSKSTMQLELGQVQTKFRPSLGLVSQEAQVTHMQGLSSLHRGLTCVWELGCTVLKEVITGLHTSPTSGNQKNLRH
jgi:hypothetical protein